MTPFFRTDEYVDNNGLGRVGQRGMGSFFWLDHCLPRASLGTRGDTSAQIASCRADDCLLAPGSGGKTWTVGQRARPTIQSAVDSSSSSGDVIVIKAGVYHEGGSSWTARASRSQSSGGQVYLIDPSTGTACFTFRNLAGNARDPCHPRIRDGDLHRGRVADHPVHHVEGVQPRRHDFGSLYGQFSSASPIPARRPSRSRADRLRFRTRR